MPERPPFCGSTSRRHVLGLTVAALPALAWPADRAGYVLINAAYPPFVLDPGDPRGDGLDVEIARAALSAADDATPVQVVLVPWRRALSMLERGEADFTTTISLNENRQQFLNFSLGYRSHTRYALFVKRGSNVRVQTLQDLKRYRVGFSAGFFYPAAIKAAVGRVFEGTDMASTLKMLQAGHTEVAVLNAYAGTWTLNQLGLQEQLQRLVFEYLGLGPTYMATSKRRDPDGELVGRLNQGIRQLQQRNRIQALEQAWLGEAG